MSAQVFSTVFQIAISNPTEQRRQLLSSPYHRIWQDLPVRAKECFHLSTQDRGSARDSQKQPRDESCSLAAQPKVAPDTGREASGPGPRVSRAGPSGEQQAAAGRSSRGAAATNGEEAPELSRRDDPGKAGAEAAAPQLRGRLPALRRRPRPARSPALPAAVRRPRACARPRLRSARRGGARGNGAAGPGQPEGAEIRPAAEVPPGRGVCGVSRPRAAGGRRRRPGRVESGLSRRRALPCLSLRAGPGAAAGAPAALVARSGPRPPSRPLVR